MQQYFDYAANLTRTDITPSKKAAMTLFGNKYGYRPLKVIHDYSTGENIRKLKSLASEAPTSSHVYICVSYTQQVRIDYSYLVETKQHITVYILIQSTGYYTGMPHVFGKSGRTCFKICHFLLSDG